MPALDYHYRTLYFLKYNNYANRIMKREDTLEDYLDASYNSTYIQVISDCKLWNPNDGVQTIITTPLHTDFSIEPDYLLVVNDDAGISTINSRWFITETVRLMSGQYECHLKRDVFAEAWEELMNASCRIRRGIVPAENPVVFNSEPLSVNQILTEETLIKDKTGCPWIVFYANKGFTWTGDSPDTPITITPATQYDLAVDHITDITGTYNTILNANNTQISFNWHVMMPNGNDICTPLINNGVAGSDSGCTVYGQTGMHSFSRYTYLDADTLRDAAITDFGYQSISTFNDVNARNGQTIYDRTADKYYTLSIASTTNTAINHALDASDTNLTTIAFEYIEGQTSVGASYTRNPKNFVYSYTRASFVASATELVNNDTITAKPLQNGYIPKDTPYFMWCMPYGNIDVVYNGQTIHCDKDLNMRIAVAMSRLYTQDRLYDIQIVPYCPIPEQFFSGDTITTNDPYLTDNTTIVDGNNDPKGVIFSCPTCTFSRQILLQGSGIVISEPKMHDICNKYRIYGPNYCSTYEFSVARNSGLRGFNIRCTYMPINPYIRVAPIWGGLYGDENFVDDVRGLVCGGDYSIARVQDAWVQYQEQNKNYQAIFNRQIESMDVLHEYDVYEQKIKMGLGIVGGAAAGAYAGSKVGGGAGAVVGGSLGAAGSGITGAMDLQLMQNRFAENQSYTADMFKMNLGNVQALPVSLARTTAFNIDNRYFPILAKYSCTDAEVNYVAQFLAERSMALDIIERPINIIDNTYTFYLYEARGYISGTILKIDSIHDTHFVDELNSEFEKGVFLR